MGRPPSGSSSAAALPAALPALARSLWRMARHVATKIYPVALRYIYYSLVLGYLEP
jgi:hypothetical protein